MKKAITILAVLIVLVGAVFASTEENHKIQIKTEVKGYEPVFQLYYDASTKTNSTRARARVDNDAEDGITIAAEGEDFSAKAANEAYETANDAIIDKTDVDISKANVSATVTAKLTGNVKLANTKTYTITFKADRLVSDVNHTIGNADPAKYYINPTAQGSTIAAAQSVPAGITMDNVSNPALVGTTLTGSIDATMGTSNIEPGNLATFTFVYPKDANAPVDYYTAYIWMVVEAS